MKFQETSQGGDAFLREAGELPASADPVYRVAPPFAYIPLSETSAALLSETETFIINGCLPVRLLALMDGSRRESMLVDLLAATARPVDVYVQLNKLRAGGFIVVGSEPVVARIASSPLFHEGGILVDFGSEPLAAASLRSGLVALQGGGPQPIVVLVDDYFDPQLVDYAAAARCDERVWLPVKALGVQPWFGPRFGRDGDPCFECLIDRLRRNRSIESWHIDHVTTGQPLRLSRHRTHASLAAANRVLVAEMAKEVEGQARPAYAGHLISVDAGTGTRHHVGRSDSCRRCGSTADPNCSARRIIMVSRPKPVARENGLRIQTPEETMAQLEPLISPHTGIVQSVAPYAGVPDEFGFPHLARFSVPIDVDFFDRKTVSVPTGGNGKGFTSIQGRLSAVCEAIERASAYYDGTTPIVRASYIEVADRAVPPYHIYGCSEAEYAAWAATREPKPLFGPGAFDAEAKIAWTPAWSLTSQVEKLVPFSFVFYSVSPEDGTNYADAASNGLASGTCLEEALLHGLLEVIERDAATAWWCNQARRPALDLDSFAIPQLARLASFLDRELWDFYALDLTHDFGVPVTVAVARHRSDPDELPRMGFGADLDPHIALTRAVTELAQSWILMPRYRLNDFCLQHDREPLWSKPFVMPSSAPPRTAHDFPRLETGDLKGDIEILLTRVAGLGLEAMAVDLSRPGYGLSVVRIIVPGLCRFWPRFATPRLVEMPVRIGWLPAPLTISEQNRIPFFYSNCGMRLDEWLRE